MTTAYSFFNYARTTNAAGILRRAKRELAQVVADAQFRFLGQDGGEIAQALCDILNDSERMMVNALPLLNRVTTSLTVTAGTSVVSLPTDVRDSDIMSLNWLNMPQGYGLDTQIMQTTYRDIAARYPYWLDGTFQENYPRSYIFNVKETTEGGSITLFGQPNLDGTIELCYRVAEDEYVAEDLDADSDKMSQIPTACIQCLAYAVAAAIARAKHGPDSSKAAALQALHEQDLAYWTENIPGFPARMGEERFNQVGEQERITGGRARRY